MGFQIDTSSIGVGLGLLSEALIRRKEQQRASQYGETTSLMRRLADPSISPADLALVKSEIARVMRIDDPENIPSDVNQFVNMLDTSLRKNFPEINHGQLDAIIAKASETNQLDSLYEQLSPIAGQLDPELSQVTNILRDAGRPDLAVQHLLGGSLGKIMGRQKAKDEAANYMLPESSAARAQDYQEKFDYQMRLTKEIEIPMAQLRASLSSSNKQGDTRSSDDSYAVNDADEVTKVSQDMINRGRDMQKAAKEKRDKILTGFTDPLSESNYQEDVRTTVLENLNDPTQNMSKVGLIGALDIMAKKITAETGEHPTGTTLLAAAESRLTEAGYKVNRETMNELVELYDNTPELTRTKYAELFETQEEAYAGYVMQKRGAENLVETSKFYGDMSRTFGADTPSGRAMELKGNVYEDTAAGTLSEKPPTMLPSLLPRQQKPEGQFTSQLKNQLGNMVENTKQALDRVASGQTEDGSERLASILYKGAKEFYNFGASAAKKVTGAVVEPTKQGANVVIDAVVPGLKSVQTPGVLGDEQRRAQEDTVSTAIQVIQSKDFKTPYDSNAPMELGDYLQMANTISVEEAGVPLTPEQEQKIRLAWKEQMEKLKGK